jgi:hypothetical protein
VTSLDALNQDFRDMVIALAVAKTEFLIIGAYAVAFHGHPRSTGDFDLWVRPTKENAARVWQALLAFGAPVRTTGLSEADLQKPDLVYQIGVVPRRIDLVTGVSGLTFDAAWSTRVEVEWQGHRIAFLGRDALLTCKRATARPKDLLDVKALEDLAAHGRQKKNKGK